MRSILHHKICYKFLSTQGVELYTRNRWMGNSNLWGHWRGVSTPSFVYTADQAALTQAAIPPTEFSPISPVRTARGEREHNFHIGNDRVTLVGSNYGAWRLRQDEGGPKLLTDSDIDNVQGHLFGGGLGYLLSARGELLCTTAYTGGSPAPEREFGTGFGRTGCAGQGGLSLEHTVAVMPGSDPIVLIEVTIHNTGTAAHELVFREAWGTGMVHLLNGHGWGGWSAWSNMSSMLDRREFVRTHYTSRFRNVSLGAARGAEQARAFHGLSMSERAFFEGAYEGRLPLPPGASLWDETPPSIFLVALEPTLHPVSSPTSAAATFSNSARDFFGSGGITSPAAPNATWRGQVTEGDTALISATALTLAPGTNSRLRFVFGYRLGDRDPALATLLERATHAFGDGERLAAVAASAWAPLLVRASVEGAPWVARELAWHVRPERRDLLLIAAGCAVDCRWLRC